MWPSPGLVRIASLQEKHDLNAVGVESCGAGVCEHHPVQICLLTPWTWTQGQLQCKWLIHAVLLGLAQG